MKTVTVKACNASSTWTERGLFFAAYRIVYITVYSCIPQLCHDKKECVCTRVYNLDFTIILFSMDYSRILSRNAVLYLI